MTSTLHRTPLATAGLALVVALGGCGGGGGDSRETPPYVPKATTVDATTPAPAAEPLTIASPMFADGAPIPVQFSCKGANVAPPLTWSSPAGAAELANHGGRQLDRAPVPFHLLPHVARELGKHTEILVDTGIMSGADIVAAIALGARCTLIGRAYLYGLMAGGEAGVNRAIEILQTGVIRTMRLLGVTCLEELSPRHVTQLRRLGPIGAPT